MAYLACPRLQVLIASRETIDGYGCGIWGSELLQSTKLEQKHMGPLESKRRVPTTNYALPMSCNSQQNKSKKEELRMLH